MDATVERFTDVYVRNLKYTGDGKNTTNIHEKSGLGLRVYPSGTKTFFFRYMMNGKPFFMTLGKHGDPPLLSLSDARMKYKEQWLELQGGGNPAMAKKIKRREVKAESELTVAVLAKEFLKEHSSKLKDGGDWQRRCLEKDVLPEWGPLPVASITDEHVKVLVKEIAKRARITANRTLAVISRMFNYAIYEASPCMIKTKINPAYRIKKPGGNEISKKRYLRREEIKTLWDKLTDPNLTPPLIMSDDMKRALLLTLVTGQRPGEVIGMHSREIDGRWWTIPGDYSEGKGNLVRGRTKNTLFHRVYLTDLALELIGDREGYIFPSPKNSNEPIEQKAMGHSIRINTEGVSDGKKRKKEKSRVRQEQNKGLNRLGISKWTPHDLRRTVFTMLSEMGYYDELIDQLQNHKKAGMSEVYNEYKYDREKMEMLVAWEKRLREYISTPFPPTSTVSPTKSAKIISLPRKAA